MCFIYTYIFKIYSHMHHTCCAKSLQSCPTVCDSSDCSPPGFSVHGALQARMLEWVAKPFSRESSRPRVRTSVSCSSCIVSRFFTPEPLGSHMHHTCPRRSTETFKWGHYKDTQGSSQHFMVFLNRTGQWPSASNFFLSHVLLIKYFKQISRCVNINILHINRHSMTFISVMFKVITY